VKKSRSGCGPAYILSSVGQGIVLMMNMPEEEFLGHKWMGAFIWVDVLRSLSVLEVLASNG
jgi:hypothetical protein